MLRWQLGLLFFIVVLQFAWAMRKQGVAVRGKFKCGLHGANYTKVRIVDIDYGNTNATCIYRRMKSTDGCICQLLFPYTFALLYIPYCNYTT